MAKQGIAFFRYSKDQSVTFIAIDDTYGPTDAGATKYVTARRRTYVGIQFADNELDDLRACLSGFQEALRSTIGVRPNRLHFTEIYNRRGIWKNDLANSNLAIFETFAALYAANRWPVHIQTIDDRTLSDHGVALFGRYDGIDVSSRDGQALLFLLLRLREKIPPFPDPLTIRIDQGNGKPGRVFAPKLFSSWGKSYDGKYASSVTEPLLQIADFLAFSINRNTYLQTKGQRTDLDTWFVDLVGSMSINSDEILSTRMPINFTPADIDQLHYYDRVSKKLESAPGSV